MASVVVIGVGNPDRGDDGAGREVVRRLREAHLPSSARIIEANGEATAILASLEGVSAAFLIDACVSGAPPGTVRRIDLSNEPLPCARYGLSSHGFGLTEAIELAKALDELPRRCIVYAIEGESFEPGIAPSAAVMRGVSETLEALKRELADL